MRRSQPTSRHSVVQQATLPRHGEGDPDLQHELLLIEMQLFRAARARQQTTKGKIVAALRSRN